MNNEFGIVNDPQINGLLLELDSILKQFDLTIKLIYKGDISSLYKIEKINIKKANN